jgi:hypothetical protein
MVDEDFDDDEAVEHLESSSHPANKSEQSEGKDMKKSGKQKQGKNNNKKLGVTSLSDIILTAVTSSLVNKASKKKEKKEKKEPKKTKKPKSEAGNVPSKKSIKNGNKASNKKKEDDSTSSLPIDLSSVSSSKMSISDIAGHQELQETLLSLTPYLNSNSSSTALSSLLSSLQQNGKQLTKQGRWKFVSLRLTLFSLS